MGGQVVVKGAQGFPSLFHALAFPIICLFAALALQLTAKVEPNALATPR